MSRKVEQTTVDGFQVITTELEFMDAADLVPELTAVLAPGYAAAGGDDSSIGKAIANMAMALTGGKLTALLPRLLKGTTVIVPDEGGKLVKIDLTEPRALNRAFTGRKKLAMGVVKLALEVNFRDFFDGVDLAGLTIPKP
jgi:hypothetical protein